MSPSVADFNDPYRFVYYFPNCHISGFALIKMAMMVFAFFAYEFAVMVPFRLNRTFQLQFTL